MKAILLAAGCCAAFEPLAGYTPHNNISTIAAFDENLAALGDAMREPAANAAVAACRAELKPVASWVAATPRPHPVHELATS